MDFKQGYGASFEIRRVDPATWTSGEPLEGLVSASVERDCTDDVPLLEAGSAEIDMAVVDSFGEGWYRIEMTAEQDGVRERHAIATLLCSSSRSNVERSRQTATLEGRSVLAPAADMLMLKGSYAPKGCDGAQYAAKLLRECIPAPVVVEGSFTLDDHAVFGVGVSYAEAAWTVLKAADWCMQVAGDGTVTIKAKPTEPAMLLDASARAAIMPGASRELDLSQVPNRYYASLGSESALVTNEDPSSPTSFQARGRWVDYIDESPVKVDGETLHAYAARRLEEMSTVVREWGYTREWDPAVNLYDLVAGTLPDFGMSGAFRVRRQSLSLGKGITVAETVGEEIREYTA